MDDLIGEFITETSESLQMLDSELVKLEQDPNNEKILGNIFRLVHTIKGTCGFLGLPRLEAVAHSGENVLGKIRDKILIVSPDAITLILKAIDCIKGLVEHLSQHGTELEGDDAALIAELNSFAESGGAAKVVHETKNDAVESNVVTEIQQEISSGIIAVAPSHEPIAKVEDIAEAVKAVKSKAVNEGLAVEVPAHTENTGEASQAQQSIRVNLDVLENLMQMVGELVLTRNQLLQIVRTRNDPVLATPLQHLSHITSELQEGIMKTRMQPIGNAWSKFPRLIRDLSHELNKKIDLHMEGAETELDRQLLEMIKDPLTHMVRNSADHGIELPDERRSKGKPEAGNITISAFHEGGHIIIKIQDDGRGLHLDRIKQKAVANGLATEADLAMLSDQQIMQFIFRAGFSTAEKVTSVLGRGVGMDVVRTNIEKIGGTVDLESQFGKGSTFNIKIPLTLAIVSVLIVESAGERFALPQINVQELVRVGGDSRYIIERINNASVLRLREALLPLISLSNILELQPQEFSKQTIAFVAVCRVGGYSFGVVVDKVFDTEEIVVKPTSQLLKQIPLYSGNTILGDGNVIMILDPNGLARATGEREIAAADGLSTIKQSLQEHHLVNFLLFRSGSGAPKAVPLELVSRLEEIDMSTVEVSGSYHVVQYRGDLMRLKTLDEGEEVKHEGIKEVIVFTYDNQTLGLVVDEIFDIVSAEYQLKISSAEKTMLGSMVLEGKTTNIVNVAALLQDMLKYEIPTNLKREDRKQIHLLLVEDSPFFRSMITPFLNTAGYHVKAVESAREALALLEANPYFDVIVSDIEMPDLDGYAFAEICQKNPKLSPIPIFAFSSSKNDENVEKGKKAGFKDFILKTDRVLLLKSISAALGLDQEQENA